VRRYIRRRAKGHEQGESRTIRLARSGMVPRIAVLPAVRRKYGSS
jgi:hypothetical protein